VDLPHPQFQLMRLPMHMQMLHLLMLLPMHLQMLHLLMLLLMHLLIDLMMILASQLAVAAPHQMLELLVKI
jgi:hypothetical protein